MQSGPAAVIRRWRNASSRSVALAALLSILTLVFARRGFAAGTQGSITVLKGAQVTVHSYLAPADGLFVTSQIIETPRQIVIVDAQYTRAYAQEVLDYAKGLNKPISRVFVSHSHPDHWSGLGVFAGYPVYTLSDIRAEIVARAARAPADGSGGNPVADIREIATDELGKGREAIDEVAFEFESVGAAEGSAHLLLRLPQAGVTIAQDLVYNGVHLYSGQNEFDRWLAVLRKLKSTDKSAIVLAGHGKPAGPDAYDKTIAYLEDLGRFRAAAKDGEELKRKLLEKYPDYLGSRLIDISLPRLYPPGR